MMIAPFSRRLRKLKYALGLAFTVAACCQTADASPWHLLIEPKFMRPEASWPIEGSSRTVLVPAHFERGKFIPLTLSEVFSRSAPREKILAESTEQAAEMLMRLVPRLIRDDNGVIQYAVLESDSPLTASAVLAPKFAGKFADSLGPELLVAIPSRFQILVFPKQSQAYLRLSETIILAYKSSPNPVSLEVFELRDGKLIAIGAYE